MIIREHYIKEVRPFYDSDLIKVITGIRRSGKSIILEQIMNEIKLKTENIIYLNFEDFRISTQIRTAEALLDYVKRHKKKGKCYLFFDEIQEVENWQAACKTLRLHKYSLFITGSNSKLLSGEFTEELSGRFVSFRVRPFVFLELQEYAKELKKEISIADYLVWGGFPKRIEFDSNAQFRYFNDLNETIVVNDLIRRYNIRKEPLFRFFINYILRSNSRIFSAKSIHDYIKNEYTCSINTIMKYLEYLKEAYIIDSLNVYSTKAKSALKFFAKIYNADVSFNSLRVIDNRFDITHNLENIVYLELLYRGYNVTVFNNKGKEIDFRAVKGNKVYYIQVAYSVSEEKTYLREFAAFEKFNNQAQKIIITNDEIDYSTSVVRHIKLKDFLICQEL